MSQPLVTVGMVTYNSSHYLKQAIESVLVSSYHNFELIISDDCSSDNTIDIARSYSDPRINIYKTEQNCYQYHNRNNVLNKAKGKYIIYIDGDDMIYPHGLEYMVKMLEAFPNVGMAVLSWYRNNIFWPIILSPKRFYTAEFFHKSFVSTALSHVIFNTAKFKQNGGFPTIHISSDDLARYRMALNWDTLVISDNHTWWRETPGQESSKLSKSLQGFIERHQQKCEVLINANCPFNEKEKKMAYLNLNIAVSKMLVKSALLLKIKSFVKLSKTVKIHPLFLFNAFKKPIVIDPFEGHDSSNPYRIPNGSNPYCKSYSKETT